MYKWIRAKLRPFYAPDTGATGGAGNGADGGSDGAEVDTTDYKALWQKEQEEKLKFKVALDKKTSELADKIKADKAKMSEEEQRAAEREEEQKRFQETLAQLNSIKTANVFAKAGFDEKDYGAVSAKLVESCGDKASEIAETLIEFVKKSTTAAVANAQRATLHDNTVLPNGQATVPNTKSDYQLYQENKTKTNNIVELK